MTDRLDFIRYLSLRPQPWRNGGGQTRELAIGNAGDQVAWRVSIADIERDGPFSTFPDFDRTITGIGAPFVLAIDGNEHPVGTHQVLTFLGEATTTCRITTPTRALNVMTRRGSCRAEVTVTSASGGWTRTPTENVDTVVVVLSGTATVAGASEALQPFDARRFAAGVEGQLDGTAELAVIHVRREA